MEKTISIIDFCNEYDKRSGNLKEKYIDENLRIEEYVPFATKLTYANMIVNSSSYNQNKKNKVHYSSDIRYILYIRSVFDMYTNLNTSSNSGFLDEYDKLKSTGLLDIIINNKIQKTEIEEFRTLINMKVDDFIRNNSSFESTIEKSLSKLDSIIQNAIVPALDKFSNSISNMDDKQADKIGKSIDGLTKILKLEK